MPQNLNFGMYAAKSQLFQRINECLQKINDPYRGFAIWPSNSLDETATPFLILDRGVHFWGPKSWIFKCMQRNRHFCRKLNNVSYKIITFLWKSIDSDACTPRVRDLTLEFPWGNHPSISDPWEGWRFLKPQMQNFRMYAASIMQNHYFSLKIHRFASFHHYRGSAIWPSNSLNKTTIPCLILDRGVDFWSPNDRIFECMQRNHNFFKELTNAYRKSTTPIKDSRSDPQILSTKRPRHFASSIGVSISEAPKAKFSNVCSEIVTFSEIWRMYQAKSLFCYENP